MIKIISLCLILFLTPGISFGLTLGSTLKVEDLNDSDTFEFIEDQVDYLNDKVRFLQNKKSIWKKEPTKIQRAEYFGRLANKAVYSYITLKDDPNLGNVTEANRNRYYRLLTELENTLRHIIHYNTQSVYLADLRQEQFTNLPKYLYDTFSITNYYYARVADKLLHVGKNLDYYSSLYTDLESDIDSSNKGLEEKRALYNQLFLNLNYALSYEFLNTPKISAQDLKTAEEELEIIADQARNFMFDTLYGGPGGAQDLGANWINQSGSLLTKLKHLSSGALLSSAGSILEFISTATYIHNFSKTFQSLTDEIWNFGTGYSDRDKAKNCKNDCLGYPDGWKQYIWPSLSGEGSTTWYMPKESATRLDAIIKRIEALRLKVDYSGQEISLSFDYSIKTYFEDAPSATASVVLRVEGGGVAPWPVSASVVFLGNTAASRDDFNGEPVQITFPSGSHSGTEKSFPLSIIDDNIAEPDESFQLYLSELSGVSTITNSLLINIADDDATPLGIISELNLRQANTTDTGVSFVVDATNAQGDPILNLSPSAFELLVNGFTYKPSSVSSGSHSGTAVTLLLDHSGSMDSSLSSMQQAANGFIDKLSPYDSAALLKFDTSVEISQDFTSNSNLLTEALSKPFGGGGTHLYDALYFAIENTARKSRLPKVIVALTDGDDFGSIHSLADVIDIAQRENTRIYMLGLGSVDTSVLQQISQGSGGTSVVTPNENDLTQIFNDVSGELAGSYVVEFSASDFTDEDTIDFTIIVDQGGGHRDAVSTTIEQPDDYDADGVADHIDLDDDDDGLEDSYEISIGTNPKNTDTDLDGMSDAFEVTFSLNPLSSHDAGIDNDGDGLTNLEEANFWTNPNLTDTDSDGIDDRFETEYNLNPKINDSDWDLDGDGLSNIDEYTNGSNPRGLDINKRSLTPRFYIRNGELWSENGRVGSRNDWAYLYEGYTGREHFVGANYYTTYVVGITKNHQLYLVDYPRSCKGSDSFPLLIDDTKRWVDYAAAHGLTDDGSLWRLNNLEGGCYQGSGPSGLYPTPEFDFELLAFDQDLIKVTAGGSFSDAVVMSKDRSLWAVSGGDFNKIGADSDRWDLVDCSWEVCLGKKEQSSVWQLKNIGSLEPISGGGIYSLGYSESYSRVSHISAWEPNNANFSIRWDVSGNPNLFVFGRYYHGRTSDNGYSDGAGAQYIDRFIPAVNLGFFEDSDELFSIVGNAFDFNSVEFSNSDFSVGGYFVKVNDLLWKYDDISTPPILDGVNTEKIFINQLDDIVLGVHTVHSQNTKYFTAPDFLCTHSTKCRFNSSQNVGDHRYFLVANDDTWVETYRFGIEVKELDGCFGGKYSWHATRSSGLSLRVEDYFEYFRSRSPQCSDSELVLHITVQVDKYKDSDNDQIPDKIELQYGLDPFDPQDAILDLDGDGLTNVHEYLNGTDLSSPGSVDNTSGNADLIWYKAEIGSTAIWHMDGTTLRSQGSPPGLADLSFSPMTTGDYNGDSKTDLLWRSPIKGQNRVWLLDGDTRVSSGALPNIDNSWEISGSGDLDGDGNDDLIWRHSTLGQNRGWLLNGTSRKQGNALPNLLDTAWKVGGIGDFDGDGVDDILWRNTVLPRNRIWLMNGFITKARNAIPNLQNNWEVAGTGDFNGDGNADILWRDQDLGQNRIWLMNGLSRNNSNAAPNLTSDWEVGGIGDLDGDGKDDIAWRNTVTGQNRIWLMDGFSRKQGASIKSWADLGWEIIGVGDVD